MLDMRKKIELACTHAGKSQASIARALGVTPQTFNKRLQTLQVSLSKNCKRLLKRSAQRIVTLLISRMGQVFKLVFF